MNVLEPLTILDSINKIKKDAVRLKSIGLFPHTVVLSRNVASNTNRKNKTRDKMNNKSKRRTMNGISAGS